MSSLVDPDRLYATVGVKIRKRREFLNMTQEQLANRVDVNRTSITNIEKGNQKATVFMLFKIASALDLLPIDLFPSREEITGYHIKTSNGNSIEVGIKTFTALNKHRNALRG